MIKNKLSILLLLICVMFFSACGKQTDESERDETQTKDSITVTDLEGNAVEFDQPPERIVPLSAGDLETIDALGAEAVGRPIMRGDIPEAFADIPEIGTSKDINMEKIVSLDSDLVIAHPDLNANDMPALEDMGIPVLQTGAESIEEIQDSIEMFGKVLQKEEEAASINKTIDDKIESFSTENELRALLVFGVPGTLMVALPNTLSGDMLDTVGGYNIARDFPELENYPGYAQIETEKILEADPEAIFLITPGPPELAKESLAEEIAKNPAWESITAVKNDHIVQLPNALFGASPGANITSSLDYLHEEIQAIQKEDSN